MIFANKLNYTLLSIYSINKNGKKNYNLYNPIFYINNYKKNGIKKLLTYFIKNLYNNLII